jgi:hypothetical protein
MLTIDTERVSDESHSAVAHGAKGQRPSVSLRAFGIYFLEPKPLVIDFLEFDAEGGRRDDTTLGGALAPARMSRPCGRIR